MPVDRSRTHRDCRPRLSGTPFIDIPRCFFTRRGSGQGNTGKRHGPCFGVTDNPKQNPRELPDREGFGSCTNYFECEAACPKEISVRTIAVLNREFGKATLAGVK